MGQRIRAAPLPHPRVRPIRNPTRALSGRALPPSTLTTRAYSEGPRPLCPSPRRGDWWLGPARQAEPLQGDGVELDLHCAAADVMEQRRAVELLGQAVHRRVGARIKAV